ncbi:DUF448 domain-containing protein [Altericroceibacterium xinjiangense]|uniref:DUF448 domain-containing protein n=1 Tax=Altericroceibacterium xinjiangense TaxID=762261 RepID=UPI000F7E2DBB|nr:DUF448 domain-containing protein [Altericroceibacterium xinjiangense]
MRNPRNEPLSSDINGTASAHASAPERRCVLSGQHGERDTLIRLALSPEGADGRHSVLPDVLARAPGRGAWIAVGRTELQTALKNGKLRGALARAFKTGALDIPDDLAGRTEEALTRTFLQRLGLEMRGGHLILGSDRIAQAARDGRVAALYHAQDASDDGARKLDQAYRVGMDAEGSGLGGIRLPLDRTALSVALGRDNVVHLALADRSSAERISIPLQRLLIFTGTAPESVSGMAVSGDRAANTAPETAATN